MLNSEIIKPSQLGATNFQKKDTKFCNFKRSFLLLFRKNKRKVLSLPSSIYYFGITFTFKYVDNYINYTSW